MSASNDKEESIISGLEGPAPKKSSSVEKKRVKKKKVKSGGFDCPKYFRLNFLKYIDFWPFYPTFSLYHIPFKFSTILSSFFSVFVFFAFASYGLLNFYSWRTDPPKVIQQIVTPPGDSYIPFDGIGLYIEPNPETLEELGADWKEKNKDILENVRDYFEVEFLLRSMNTDMLWLPSKTIELIPSKVCKLDRDFFCLAEAASLNSPLTTQTQNFLEVNIKKKPEATAMTQEIMGALQVWMYIREQTYKDGEFLDVWQAWLSHMYKTTLTENVFGGWDLYMRRYFVEVRQDYFTQFSNKNYEGIKIFFYDSITKPRLDDHDEQVVYRTAVYMDSRFIQEFYSRGSVFDLLGQIGSIFNVGLLFLSILMWNWNRINFYRVFRGWDNLDSKFVHRNRTEFYDTKFQKYLDSVKKRGGGSSKMDTSLMQQPTIKVVKTKRTRKSATQKANVKKEFVRVVIDNNSGQNPARARSAHKSDTSNFN